MFDVEHWKIQADFEEDKLKLFRRLKMRMDSELYTMEDEMESVQRDIESLQDKIRANEDSMNNRRRLADLTAKESVLSTKIDDGRKDMKLLGQIINQSRRELCTLETKFSCMNKKLDLTFRICLIKI